MNRKSQVLIIFLWILAGLTILTVSLGNQISMFLKFTQSRRDILKAEYLAYAGANRAIAELREDKDLSCDGLNDTWVDNKDIFEKIQLSDNPAEYATVINEDGKFGLIDEERKININEAPEELLFALLDYYKIPSAQEIVNNILIWRDDKVPDPGYIYTSLGYPRKGKLFANIAELMLVKGMEAEDFKKIAKVITVHGLPGDAKININTASPEVITIFCRSIASKNSGCVPSDADKVASQFISENNRPVFKKVSDIPPISSGCEGVIFNEFMNKVKFNSDYFLIEVIGNAGRIKAKLTLVYNRDKNQIESWYEG